MELAELQAQLTNSTDYIQSILSIYNNHINHLHIDDKQNQSIINELRSQSDVWLLLYYINSVQHIIAADLHSVESGNMMYGNIQQHAYDIFMSQPQLQYFNSIVEWCEHTYTSSAELQSIHTPIHDKSQLYDIIWQCIRSGELQTAIELCRKHKYYSVAATLSGGLYSTGINSSSKSGSMNRLNWLSACNMVAQSSSTNHMVRSIYSVLGHSYKYIAEQADSTFNDIVWCYYKVLLNHTIDQFIQGTTDTVNHDIDKLHLLLSNRIHTTYDRIIYYILTQQYSELHTALSLPHTATTTDNPDIIDCYYAQFIVHLSAYGRTHMPTEIAIRPPNQYIQLYVTVLSQLQLHTIIPLYITQLQPHDQIQLYIQYLMSVESTDQIKQLLHLAKQYLSQPVLNEITRQVVDNAINTPIKRIGSTNQSQELDETELETYIDNLLCYDITSSQQQHDLMNHLTCLYDKLMQQQDTASMTYTYQRTSHLIDTPINDQDTGVEAYVCYTLYIESLLSIDEYTQLSTDQQIAMINQLYTTVTTFITYNGGFMSNNTTLKQQIIPDLVHQLYQICYNADNMRLCFGITDLITEKQLYNSFTKQQLQQLLRNVKRAYTELKLTDPTQSPGSTYVRRRQLSQINL